MIKLAFIGPQRKVIRFTIDGKKVVYFDENWKEGVQIYPMDKKLVRKLLNAKKREKLRMMGGLIVEANVGTNLEEYNSCKTEEDIAKIVIKDCKSKGLLEAK